MTNEPRWWILVDPGRGPDAWWKAARQSAAQGAAPPPARRLLEHPTLGEVRCTQHEAEAVLRWMHTLPVSGPMTVIKVPAPLRDADDEEAAQ